ncbi:DUF885 domain-containing protein [Egibacter rhizosphaerae]|uniref:DUF885 domain-containing protein n=1 Tax=Egibacter rhizosphaerae TaxID=1670831 RepID=A0A411YFF8_9ACTN|nr:DUF885 domain-containing protein [Egibacter rhizosphaerae]QBI19911.1 DUF885 domain-containing protein [Egibacter rhizosphaerae]
MGRLGPIRPRGAPVARPHHRPDDADAAADALAAFGAWLTDELAPQARGHFPLGEEALGRLLADHHLLDESPAAVAARGEALCARTDEAMAELAPQGDWRAALHEAKQHRPDHEGLLPAYREAAERMTARCAEAGVVTDPGVPLTVEATPEFLRPMLSYAAYLAPGAFDELAGAGRFWVTPPGDDGGLTDHNFATIQSVSAHEGYPGHHLQLTAVGRNPGIARRMRVSTLMTEGWGLYCEELMAEVGAYDDAARLAQLAMTKLRAVRICVDMGLQTGAMSPEEAVDRLAHEADLARSTAAGEVDRYTFTPDQPFTYLYGAEQIRELRAAWRARHGGGLRAFHDELLRYGHFPPELAAERMLAGSGRSEPEESP